MSLEAVVRHYVKHHRTSAQDELAQFRDQPSDEAAVAMAALAEDAGGRRFSHQFRIQRTALEAAHRKLVPAAADLAAQRSFGSLYRRIEEILNPVAGLGLLYKYDTALRIGARFGILPQQVFLHAGTRAGAAALGLDADQRFLFMRDFPPELRVVEPHQLEDILCIYKGVLADANHGRPVDLPDDSRCFLDDPQDAE